MEIRSYRIDRNTERKASENHARNICDPQIRRKFPREKNESIGHNCEKIHE